MIDDGLISWWWATLTASVFLLVLGMKQLKLQLLSSKQKLCHERQRGGDLLQVDGVDGTGTSAGGGGDGGQQSGPNLLWSTPQPNQKKKKLPSPTRLPLLGHLHLLNGDPFVQMTRLSAKYGEIYYLHLGTVPTVVVSSLKLMKEILVGKGAQFGHRPDFRRYHILFGGSKENSLAFCDWSETQKLRRALARKFCHTKMFANRAEESIERGSNWLLKNVHENLTSGQAQTRLKQNIHQACANIFFQFFSSQSFEDELDEEFNTVVRYFDEIFWDINQSHPTDVLPILVPLYRSYFNNMSNMSQYIRNFVLDRIIPRHLENLDNENPEDLVDNLLLHIQNPDESNKLTMEQVLFELEDFIGGHAAVANLVARALVEIAAVPGMSDKIYNECVKMNNSSAYMQAVLYETLRKTSSPIVPHVASENTMIAGYEIKKGTMVIFNNYELNLSSKYWEEPEKFLPERFLTVCGRTFRRPAHFLPFSTGKRACMGYKLVEEVFEGILKAIVTKFQLHTINNGNHLPLSCVALHPHTQLNIHFQHRII